MVIGLILVAVGIIALLSKLDIIGDSVWSYTWPTILIILGVWFLTRRWLRRSWWCGWDPGSRRRDRSLRDD